MELITQESIQEAIQYKDVRLAVLTLNWAKKHPDFKIDPQQDVQLKYVRINSLSVENLTKLLKTSILAAYTVPDFLLSDAIDEYVVELENIDQEIILFKNIISKS